MELKHSIETPREVELKRSIETPREVEVKRSIETPREVEVKRSIETPREVEVKRSSEPPRLAKESVKTIGKTKPEEPLRALNDYDMSMKHEPGIASSLILHTGSLSRLANVAARLKGGSSVFMLAMGSSNVEYHGGPTFWTQQPPGSRRVCPYRGTAVGTVNYNQTLRGFFGLMGDRWPHARHMYCNIGSGGADVAFYLTCPERWTPSKYDILIVEALMITVKDDAARQFERLLRHFVARDAAVILYTPNRWRCGKFWELGTTRVNYTRLEALDAWSCDGGEAALMEVAQYYDIPVVSTRSAFYLSLIHI